MSEKRTRRQLREAVDPFRRVTALMAPLSIDPDKPLHDVVPGLWPSWGELKALVAACEAILSEGHAE